MQGSVGTEVGVCVTLSIKKAKPMSKEQHDKTFFISFCIELYKNAKGISGEQAMMEFDKYGVLEYLDEFFDVLHTQSHHWILADIEEFINTRKAKTAK